MPPRPANRRAEGAARGLIVASMIAGSLACSAEVIELDPLDLGAPQIPEPTGPLTVVVTRLRSGQAVGAREVVFVSPWGEERSRTDALGRAASTEPATDVHVFNGAGSAWSVLGAPSEIEVVIPGGEGPESGVVVSGQIQAPAGAQAARLVALAPDVELDGWAAGSADPAAGGLPTHLPRFEAGRFEAPYRVRVGPRARAVAALVYGDGDQPIAVGVAAIDGPSVQVAADAVIGPEPTRIDAPIELIGLDEISTDRRIDTPWGHLRYPSGLRRDGRFELPCEDERCTFDLILRRRQSLRDDARGVVVDARGLADFTEPEAARRLLPGPPAARRSGRVVDLVGRVSNALELQLQPAGSWRVVVLDARDRFELPDPSDPIADPLAPTGDPEGLATRTDLQIDDLDLRPLRTNHTPRRRASAWSVRRWIPD